MIPASSDTERNTPSGSRKYLEDLKQFSYTRACTTPARRRYSSGPTLSILPTSNHSQPHLCLHKHPFSISWLTPTCCNSIGGLFMILQLVWMMYIQDKNAGLSQIRFAAQFQLPAYSLQLNFVSLWLNIQLQSTQIFPLAACQTTRILAKLQNSSSESFI